MNKEKLLLKIVEYLTQENNYSIEIPHSYDALKKLYKTFVNIRFIKIFFKYSTNVDKIL